MAPVRWNIAVSAETDKSQREETVQAHILELSVEQAKATNTEVREDDLMAIINEAVQWSRER